MPSIVLLISILLYFHCCDVNMAAPSLSQLSTTAVDDVVHQEPFFGCRDDYKFVGLIYFYFNIHINVILCMYYEYILRTRSRRLSSNIVF